MLNDRMIGESGLSRDPEEVALSGDDKKASEGHHVHGAGVEQDLDLSCVESGRFKKEVSTFSERLQEMKKDLDFNAERLGKLEKEIQQNPNYRISLDDSISQEEQIKKLRTFVEKKREELVGELGELFDHLVSTASKNKKEEVDDYLGVVQQYLDILGESFLKDVKEVVRVVNSIIDKTTKQE